MRYFIELSYLGTAYHGWQRQNNAATVQECIEVGLSTILRCKTEVTGCGRTDAGVHAKQFFLHFDHEGLEDLKVGLCFKRYSSIRYQYPWNPRSSS